MPVLRPVAAGSSVTASHRRTHPPPFVMRRRRAVAFVVVVAVVAPVRPSWRKKQRSANAGAKLEEGQGRCPPHGPGLTVFSRMVPEERRLPLALVRIPARLPCQKETNIRNFSKQFSRLDFWGRPWVRPRGRPAAFSTLQSPVSSEYVSFSPGEERGLGRHLLFRGTLHNHLPPPIHPGCPFCG